MNKIPFDYERLKIIDKPIIDSKSRVPLKE